MGNASQKISGLNAFTRLAAITASIIIVAWAASLIRFRIDLTEDHRYTLSAPTRKILSGLKNDIYIEVYLDGDIQIPLKRLRRSVMETLEEFRIASGRKVDYRFINPMEGSSEQRKNMAESLVKKGLTYVRAVSNDQEGGSSEKYIFPGMIINYNGIEVPVNFLNNNSAIPYEQRILHSAEALEYNVIQTISTLSSDTIYKVAFLEGHGELSEVETADITLSLAKYFTVDRGTIGGRPGALDRYSAVVIAGPKDEFSEADKFVIDQYIMKGGRVLWLFDEVYVNNDSLALGETAAIYRPLNIEDQLFRYGARVNPAIVRDVDCQMIRIKVVGSNGNQQYVPVPWIYYPLLSPSSKHPLTRNLNRIRGEFVNYIDTVGLDTSIRKTVLLRTSKYTRLLTPPALVSLSETQTYPDEKEYNLSYLPVALLLEGRFSSVFRNRMISSFIDVNQGSILNKSPFTRMIVVADGDIIRNEVRHSGRNEVPQRLGQDPLSGEIYGNSDFIVNCLNYLVDDKGLMELRSREMKIRLLDPSKVRSERLKWQLINIACPVLLVLIAGFLYNYYRKRRYTG
ncbi:MAG TPA: gliding motility-associated ABC transporter substrate-binding protein GldG [Bacteroidales bacterium]|jgi:gliding-associated putative ABC transporter substrate-binding component GldG|nr:gliding motility-associated ABC transporter substrate-binding protein GldG [Bacteroidales bacterium]